MYGDIRKFCKHHQQALLKFTCMNKTSINSTGNDQASSCANNISSLTLQLL